MGGLLDIVAESEMLALGGGGDGYQSGTKGSPNHNPSCPAEKKCKRWKREKEAATRDILGMQQLSHLQNMSRYDSWYKPEKRILVQTKDDTFLGAGILIFTGKRHLHKRQSSISCVHLFHPFFCYRGNFWFLSGVPTTRESQQHLATDARECILQPSIREIKRRCMKWKANIGEGWGRGPPPFPLSFGSTSGQIHNGMTQQHSLVNLSFANGQIHNGMIQQHSLVNL